MNHGEFAIGCKFVCGDMREGVPHTIGRSAVTRNVHGYSAVLVSPSTRGSLSSSASR